MILGTLTSCIRCGNRDIMVAEPALCAPCYDTSHQEPQPASIRGNGAVHVGDEDGGGDADREDWLAALRDGRITGPGAERMTMEPGHPWTKAEPTGRKVSYRSYTAAELDAGDFGLEYLIDNILVAGQPAIISGRKKTLKTGIAVEMAIALTTATPFLGRFAVKRTARVAMMSGESGEATLQETARRIAASRGWRLADIPGLVVSPDIPTLGHVEHLDALREFIGTHQVEALIIDPTYMAMPVGDGASNLFVVGDLLRGVTAIGQETGCTVILVHHNRKGADGTVPELDDIAWAGFGEWARQWILLARRTPFDAEGGGRHELWCHVGGSAGHHGLWALDITEGRRSDPGGRRWDVAVQYASTAIRTDQEAAASAKAEAKALAESDRMAEHRRKVLAAVRRYPDGETFRVLRETAGLHSEHFRRAVLECIDAGDVVACQIVKGKRTYEGYRACPAQNK